MKREKIELIRWTDRLSCGIKLIDDQHKGLVAMVNEMFNHVTGNEEDEREYFSSVIEQAVKYVKVHFATEEKIMLAAKSPDYARHKRAHNRFIVTVLDNIHYYETGKKQNLYAFTKYLKDWILSHIALTDKQCFEDVTKLYRVTRIIS